MRVPAAAQSTLYLPKRSKLMNKYITIVELGEDSTEFAERIGICGFFGNRYVCESVDSDGNRIHRQTFSLPKGIEGLPENNEQLSTNVLASWKSEQAKVRKAQGLEVGE